MTRLARALGKAEVEQPLDMVEARVVYNRDKWRCGLCGKKINPVLRHPHPLRASLDHVVPISRGGTHTYANTQAAHLQCNVRKNNRGSGEQLALI